MNEIEVFQHQISPSQNTLPIPIKVIPVLASETNIQGYQALFDQDWGCRKNNASQRTYESLEQLPNFKPC